MTVAAILRHKGYHVETVPPDTSLLEVALRLTAHRIGAVLVRDEHAPLLGIVSERDVVRALAHYGCDALERPATDVMTVSLRTATPATTEEEVMALMTESRIRHVPVVEHGELVGLISIGDVVKARIDAQTAEVDSLKAYVAGGA